MRDDERYPIPIAQDEYHNGPEVLHHNQVDTTGRDKLVLEQDAIKPEDKDKQDPSYSTDKEVALGETPPQHKRICGLRRRTFLIILVIAVIIIIGAVVGGVVGGLKSKSSNSSDPKPPATSDSPEPPIQTGPIEASQRSISVSTSADAKTQELQLFYQDLSTQTILYKRIQNDKSKDEQKLNLSITPNWGTALSAAAVNASLPISTQIFYLSTDKENVTNIAQATLNCIPNLPACDVKSNSIITTNISQPIYAKSKLASLRFDKDTVRVYYQIANGDIWVLNGGKADSSGWTTSRVRLGGYLGASLTVFAPAKDNINVFWINKAGQLRFLNYSDLLGPQADSLVDGSPGSEWSPQVSMTGVFTSRLDVRRAFFAKPDNGTLISYFQRQGQFKPNHDANWTATVTGGLTATMFGEQTRLYYFSGNDLVVQTQDGLVWEKIKTL